MRTSKIILLVPAHNEEVGIVQTMESVEAQTLQPDRRIVICDNCTDATPSLARSRPDWEVWETVGNTGKKGGALNQAWDRLSDDLDDDDYIVTMDADTLLDEHFVANAYAKYQQKQGQGHRLGGVCANFHGLELDSALGVLQKMEYARAEKINRSRRGRAPGARRRGDDVLRPGAARGLRARAGRLYKPVLTEDYELSLALRVQRLRDDGAAQLLRADRPHADGADAVGAAAALVPRRVRVPA